MSFTKRYEARLARLPGGTLVRVLSPEGAHEEASGAAVSYADARCVAHLFADKILAALPPSADPLHYVATIRFHEGESETKCVPWLRHFAGSDAPRRTAIEAANRTRRMCVDFELDGYVAVASFEPAQLRGWAAQWGSDGDDLHPELNEATFAYCLMVAGIKQRTEGPR